MELLTVLLVILVVAAIVVCAVCIWAFREVGVAARSVRSLADDTKRRLVPLIEKTDVTVDAVNAELLRVDMLVTQFEDAARQVTKTSSMISDIANAPERIAGGVADRVRAWRGRKRTTGTHGSTEPVYEDLDLIDQSLSDDVVEEPVHVTEDQWQQT